MRVRVNCITIIPAKTEPARYDVIDVDGKVTVVAQQSDVKIRYRGTAARRSKQENSSDVTVHQGEQATRDERCGVAAKPAEVINAQGAILNSVWAKGAGLAAVYNSPSDIASWPIRSTITQLDMSSAGLSFPDCGPRYPVWRETARRTRSSC